MHILGIDYGRKKIGLALAISKLAEPYMVVRYKQINDAVSKIREIIKKEEVEKIVLGISEGEMEIETKNFGQELSKTIDVPVEYQDETLTSSEAITRSIDSGMRRSKRKSMEDAFAATIMLQDYLDLLF